MQVLEQDNRSITRVLHSIVDNVEVLVESKVELAKAELREAVHEGTAAVLPLGIGLVLGQLAVGALLLAAITGLGTRLPLWQAALIVGAFTGIVALVMIAKGRKLLTLVGQSSSATALRRGGISHG